jgi:predicted amidohydrolase
MQANNHQLQIMNKIKLAALQLQLNKTDNLDFLLSKLNDLVKSKDDLDIIILSELAVGGAGAKNCNHPLSKYEKIFSEFAKNNSIFLIPGTFYEEDVDKVLNVAPVFNREGNLIAKAKKIYPWLPYELDVDSSDEICVFNFEDKGNIGIHICYDLWFPETARALAIAGAELIINPTMTPTKDRDIETVMVQATAAQQQCYYVDINASGEQGNGKSLICDYEGSVIDNANNENKILEAEIDFDKVRESRMKGFMGLGQPLKSFRDNPFNPVNYMDKEYLDSLGDLKKNKS